eukprot:1023122-Pelagomonas_calceolata.AAC.2
MFSARVMRQMVCCSGTLLGVYKNALRHGFHVKTCSKSMVGTEASIRRREVQGERSEQQGSESICARISDFAVQKAVPAASPAIDSPLAHLPLLQEYAKQVGANFVLVDPSTGIQRHNFNAGMDAMPDECFPGGRPSKI